MNEQEETQQIRLFDVFVIGPVMIWTALQCKGIGPILRAILGVSGAMTVFYNGANFIAQREQIERETPPQERTYRLGRVGF